VSEPLFRPEVLAERQTQWLGTVLLTPRPSHRFFTVFAVIAAAAVLGLLLFGDFTRKERISGWLVPQQGLIRVFAPQAAVVTQIYVQEGGEVRKGDPLVVLSTELQSAALGATQAEIAHRIGIRRDSLKEEQLQQQRLAAQQTRALSGRLSALQAEQAQLEREIALQQSRVRLAEKSATRQRQLRESGFISDQQLQIAEESGLEQGAKLRALERNRIATLRDRLALESEFKDLPLKSNATIAGIERDIAVVEQALAETEARREIVLSAPRNGIVTAIQAEPGGRANPALPLLNIVPLGAKLEAHLFSPTRSVGFVRPGQRVLLRYQAYPYQKFGHYEGAVANVSRSAVNPAELPAQLAGLSSLYGTNELVYRITVNLSSQAVVAYGQPVPLQPGMQLDADIAIEKRRLIEWVLDPLFTLTGKWNG
jgi:membrane fusion protein